MLELREALRSAIKIYDEKAADAKALLSLHEEHREQLVGILAALTKLRRPAAPRPVTPKVVKHTKQAKVKGRVKAKFTVRCWNCHKVIPYDVVTCPHCRKAV